MTTIEDAYQAGVKLAAEQAMDKLLAGQGQPRPKPQIQADRMASDIQHPFDFVN